MERPSGMRDLTDQELTHITKTGTCPYCDGQLYAGPRAGLSVNLRCASCCIRLNVSTELERPFAGQYIGHDPAGLPLYLGEGGPPTTTPLSVLAPALLAIPEQVRTGWIPPTLFAVTTVVLAFTLYFTWFWVGSGVLIVSVVGGVVATGRAWIEYLTLRKLYNRLLMGIVLQQVMPHAIIRLTNVPPEQEVVPCRES